MKNNNEKKIKDLILNARKKHGLTIEKAAEKCGLSLATYYSAESGRSQYPNLKIFKKIIKNLNINMKEAFNAIDI